MPTFQQVKNGSAIDNYRIYDFIMFHDHIVAVLVK